MPDSHQKGRHRDQVSNIQKPEKLDQKAFVDGIKTEYPEDQKLDELIRSFESNLRDALHNVAPERMKKITTGRKQLVWKTTEITETMY